jgi:hypothetical protein
VRALDLLVLVLSLRHDVFLRYGLLVRIFRDGRSEDRR